MLFTVIHMTDLLFAVTAAAASATAVATLKWIFTGYSRIKLKKKRTTFANYSIENESIYTPEKKLTLAHSIRTS